MSEGIVDFRQYRVKRNSEHATKFKRISEALGFKNKDILMVSAILGFRNKTSKPIEKPHQDGILMMFFQNEDIDVMNLIAYAHTGGQEILKSEKKFEIVESYANAGFEYLWKALELTDDETPLTINDKKIVTKKYYNLMMSLTDDEVEGAGEELLESLFL